MHAVQNRIASVHPWHDTHLTPVHDEASLAKLLEAYREFGGLAMGEDIAARYSGGGLSDLAKAIAAREVIGTAWGGHRWLPNFQFECESLAVREQVHLLMTELASVLDDTGLVEWFVQPNSLLDGALPLQMLDSDFARVHDAARALRFICNY